jgi:hypothetical protein
MHTKSSKFVLTAIAGLLLVACAPASPSETVAGPTVTATVATTAASTSPTPASTPDPVVTAGPLTVAGEFSFGISDFGGQPYGLPYEDYASLLGPTVHQTACGDENFPAVVPGSSASFWWLNLVVPWDDPNLAWLDWDTKAFLLNIQSYTRPTTPTGPVGPRGLRLGTPEATIEAMFPAEAAATTTRTTTYFNFATDADENITERLFTIPDLDGGPMIISVVDGYVASMMWGDPAYVVPERSFLRCNT